MGVFRTIVFVVIATWLGCSSALAEKRVALVIGNSAYKNVPRLANPVNDATMAAAMMKTAGFALVTTKLDVNIVEMRKARRLCSLEPLARAERPVGAVANGPQRLR
jgi:hypothetical protein